MTDPFIEKRLAPLEKLLAHFGERRFARTRVVVLCIVLLWSIVGAFLPRHDLPSEAALILPWAIGCLGASMIWWAILHARPGRFIPSRVADVVGDALNIIIIGLLFSKAFYLVPALVLGLPVVSVMAAVRYGRFGFWLTVAIGTVMTFAVAPGQFWVMNPGYVLLTIALLVGLPILLANLVNALRDALVETLASKEAQERFVVAMSHELRTPVTTIITSTDLLTTNGFDPSQQTLLASVKAGAKSLKARVDALLDAGALARGTVTARPVPTCFVSLLGSLRDTWRPIADRAHVELTVNLDAPMELPALMADPGMVEQVITNLVQNAIRYTPSGGSVSVRASIRPFDSGRMQFSCRVIDTGCGVPDDVKPNIFDAFRQAQATLSPEEAGVGLGLYIVRRITDLLQATIAVTDNPGGGTIFTWNATFPVTNNVSTAAAPSALELIDRHRHRVDPMRILIVDDDLSDRVTLDTVLTRAGHITRLAANIADAETTLDARWPTLLMLDLHLDGKSGIDCLRRWRRAAVPVPPVVLITGDIDVDAREAAGRGDVSAFIAKPVSIDRILGVIESIRSKSENDLLEFPGAAAIANPLDELRAIGAREDVSQYLVAAHDGLLHQLAAIEAALAGSGTAGLSGAVHALRNEFLSIADRDGVDACSTWVVKTNQGFPTEGDLDVLRTQVYRACNDIAAEPEFPAARLGAFTPAARLTAALGPR